MSAATENGSYAITAGPADGNLGWSPASYPPNPVFVAEVEPGSFAERQGISARDQLVEVNGRGVNELTKRELRGVMNSRPVTMKFNFEKAVSQKDSAPESEVVHLSIVGVDGSELASLQLRGNVRIHAVKEQLASLLSVPAVLQQLLLGELVLTSQTELASISNGGSIQATLVRQSTYEVTAGESDSVLGLRFRNFTCTPICVDAVTPGSWAEAQGVSAGDIIVGVNGQDIEDILDKLIPLFKARPLSLRFCGQMQQSEH